MPKELEMEVRIALLKKEMKHADLAKQLGISGPYLSDLISGKRDGEKARERVKQICKILGIKSEVMK